MGAAFDPEELGLPAESLRWESSLDGPLGSGKELQTSGLRQGTHRIALIARDRAGNESRRELTITVAPGTPRPVRESATEREILVRLGVLQVDVGGGGDHRYLWIGALGACAAGCVALLVFLLRKGRSARQRFATPHDP